jgi:hypothetical protein
MDDKAGDNLNTNNDGTYDDTNVTSQPILTQPNRFIRGAVTNSAIKNLSKSFGSMNEEFKN